MGLSLLDFALASVIMSLGIGADVAIATALRAKYLRTTSAAIFWIAGVSATHTIFPMLGYLLTYFSVQMIPGLTPIVGLIAFFCIFYYLKSEWQTIEEDAARKEVGQLMLTFGLILAVSWDALWSGPAKSAQVIGWPETLVWISFIIVGMLVSLLAISSLWFAKKANIRTTLSKPLTSLGVWIQYSVIGYFGILALFRYTLGVECHWVVVLAISLCLTALMLFLKRPILGFQRKLAR